MSSPEERRPVLVTGIHRSGTTWIGKMLAAGGELAYISEPLNVWHRPGVFKAPVSHWYTYICRENEAEYLPAFSDLLAYRYHLWGEIKSLRSSKDFLRMGRDLSIFVNGKLRNQRPLLKDPFAVFSIPWFVERLQTQVVVAVRHPAAFVSSLKRLGWDFHLEDLLTQPLLMRDWLEADRPEIQRGLQLPQDMIRGAALLWRLVYQTIQELQARYPQVIVVRHEDLSQDPVAAYQKLYAPLGLDFSAKVVKAILESSSNENPAELSKQRVHQVKLDSRANLKNWRRRLTEEEVEKVRELTRLVANGFYSEDEW